MGLALKKEGEAFTKIKEALRIGNPRIRKKKILQIIFMFS